MERVWIDNLGEIPLDPSLRLGSGVFGSVYKYKDLAVKVWHTPNKPLADRLEFAISQTSRWTDLTGCAVLPISLVRKKRGGQINGMTMPLLDQRATDVGLLFRQMNRKSQNITQRDIVRFGVNAFATLAKIHAHKLCVVDINPRNLLYVYDPSQKQMLPWWIDFDSWYIDAYPKKDTLMYTPAYVDPVLREARNPIPTADTDNYSLWVLIFKLITSEHPYGGTHPTIDNFEERVKQRIWAYASGITLPNFAMRREIFSDELLAGLEKLFVHHDISELSLSKLERYAQSLTECASCHLWFPQSRKTCPACSARNTAAMPTEASHISLVTLIQTLGTIAFARFQDGKLICVAYEGNELVLYVREKAGTATRKSLFPYRPSLRFDVISDTTLVVNSQGSQEIELWDITKDYPRHFDTTSSELFAANKDSAVFRGTHNKFYRLAGHSLMEGSVRFNQLVDVSTAVPTSKTQTWFWADPNANCVIGFTQTYEHQEFWILSKGIRIDGAAIAQMRKGEALYEISVRFGKDSILVRRRTKDGNTEYLRTEVVSLSGESVLTRVEELSSRRHVEIHNFDYSDHEGTLTVWHPTNNGIVVEELSTSRFQTLSQTKHAISSQDRLIHLGFGTHFLVIRDSNIDYLTIK